MKLIVGLGNPEAKYDNTFHNMGFNVVERYSDFAGVKIKKLECLARVYINNNYILAKPQTYMNLSGESVKSLMQKYKIEPSDMLVVYDDLDIDRGTVRIRVSGSGGTHNGMRNIISCIGRQDFPRLRMGRGRPDGGGDIKDFVLAQIPQKDYAVIDDAVNRAVNAIDEFIHGETVENIMNRYNG